jgi:probable rRNA maturation factor
MNDFVINSTIKQYPKRLPYREIKRKLLGQKYHLSLNFIGRDRAQNLNEQYRKKNYVPNVLSFPLDEAHGEIYICPAASNREAKAFGLSQSGYIAYLFIHGILHLKGHDHGDKMEQLERKYVRSFNIK